MISTMKEKSYFQKSVALEITDTPDVIAKKVLSNLNMLTFLKRSKKAILDSFN